MLNFLFSEIMVLQYFADSNFAGKAIVIILIVFSALAWTVMLMKASDLHEFKTLNANVERRLAKSSTVMSALAENRHMKGPYAALLNEAIAAWGRVSGDDYSPEMLSIRMGHVENALQRCVARQTMRYETKMVLLGSIISGAPFLGLLGTVWGVMDSFGSMGKEGAVVTLQALAPGVSGALLTTVAGLIVAIPSVFGYNYLLTLSRGMVLEIENFASSLADRIELEGREWANRKMQTYKPVNAPVHARAQDVNEASSKSETSSLEDLRNVGEFEEPKAPEPLKFNLDEDVDGEITQRNYDD